MSGALPAETLIARARAAYEAQNMETATAAAAEAAKRHPDHPGLAFMHAQFAYEGWYPATALFEKAAALDPGNPDLARNFALALASEGEGQRAERLLEGILARHPGWIAGHEVLAKLRITSGGIAPDSSFRAALAAEPDNASLHHAAFHQAATTRDWERAEAIVALGERNLGVDRMAPLRLFLACESGVADADPALFARFEGAPDPGLALLQVRHALRHGEAHRALAVAEAQLVTPHAGQFWPYVELCWRLIGDPRAGWLDGGGAYCTTTDIGLSDAGLEALARFLRALHTMTAPYPEQSVRGGTQTDRNLLLHHAPIIRDLRGRIEAVVRNWRDSLPEGPPDHPFLKRKPGLVRFSGCWSVRLREGGHHSPHTHPQGWASSALYVAVPPAPAEGHAGALALGMPPTELGLPLEATAHVQPQPGRLALFPSTSWHGTVPFAGEERLTVAFDVAPA